MSGFTLVTLLIIILMGWYTKSVNQEIQKSRDDAAQGTIRRSISQLAPPGDAQKQKSVHELYKTEAWVMCGLQFSLFFVCYGVARMICQPWMWELHFWPVFTLSLVALVSAILFVWLVSPAIPNFCGAMAMPPYVDDDNMQMMLRVAGSVSRPGCKV